MDCPTLQDAQEQVGAPKTSFQVGHPPNRFLNYAMAIMSSIIDAKPSSFQKATHMQVSQDAMVEEYNSIMRIELGKIVPRPNEKSMIDSRWWYKVSHATNGNIEKYKA